MFAIAIGGYSIYAAVGASIPPLSSEITRARAAPLPVAKTVDS